MPSDVSTSDAIFVNKPEWCKMLIVGPCGTVDPGSQSENLSADIDVRHPP